MMKAKRLNETAAVHCDRTLWSFFNNLYKIPKDFVFEIQ